MNRKDVLVGIYKRGLENAPWLKDIPSDEKDAMAKKVAGQVDSWLTSSSSTAQVNTQLQEQTSKPLDGASCSFSYSLG